VIRWNEPEGQGGEVQLAALDTSVLRYDGQGQLVVPIHPEPVEEETREGEGAEAAADVSFSTKGVAAPRDILPSIRLIATRYQDHPALARLDLTPAEWSAFFQAMIKVESNYTQGAVSHAGALGLAQLMPGTATYLGVDPADPIENLDGGARYLLEQMTAFGSLELALAAYNAGPEAVRKYDGVPPYAETQSHIVKVMAVYDRILTEL
jgi:soluble lytic murein transglycosylase-like protein